MSEPQDPLYDAARRLVYQTEMGIEEGAAEARQMLIDLAARDRPGLDVAWTPRAGATVEHDDKVYTVAYYTIIVDGRNGSASLTARLRLAAAQQREGAGE